MKVWVPVTLLFALALPGRAAAHLGSTKLVWIEVGDRGADVRVDLDPVDVAYELEADDPDHATADALLPRADEIRAWATDAFSVHSADGPCEPSARAVDAVDVEGALRMTRAIRVELRFACAARPVRFEDHAVFDSDPQHEAIVRVGERPTVLRAGRQRVSLEQPSAASVIGTFLLEGVTHMVTGYDHVLFLLSLLLVAGEVAAREGTKRSLRDVALMVTAFTVGHSITLIAAALDVVSLPSRWVESAIAGSIVAVAAWNVVRPRARSELRWVAGLFGLVHGFGFSSVLRQLILPTEARVGALLAFNLGIELAQLGIVLAVVPLLEWAGRKPWYHRAVVQVGSAIVGAIGLYWLVTRALGL